MKILLKIFKYTALILAVIILTAFLTLYFFKDQLIRQFVDALNQHLNTPVKVGKIDVTLLDHFPEVSVVFTDLYVEDSQPGEYPLLTADKISFTLHPIELFNHTYIIRGLTVQSATLTLKTNSAGTTNFNILKETSGQGSAVDLDLQNVRLKNVTTEYRDQRNKVFLLLATPELEAGIRSKNNTYFISATGTLQCDTAVVDGLSFFARKTLDLDMTLEYNDAAGVVIRNSQVGIGSGQFSIQGSIDPTKNQIDLKTKGEKTELKTLLSLLPPNVGKSLEEYRSEGKVYFTLDVAGKSSNPSVKAAFGFEAARIFHPALKTSLESVNLTGSFATPTLTEFSDAVLVLKDFSGNLNNRTLEGNLIIQNFLDPSVQGSLRGEATLESLMGLFPDLGLQQPQGILKADLNFKGKLAVLQRKATAQQFQTSGSLELLNIGFNYGSPGIPVLNTTGSLQFNNNDLALSEVHAQVGKSDFTLNGYFKNIITYLLFDDQPIGIEADVVSKTIDADELLMFGFGDRESKNSEFNFSISKNLYVNFNCKIDELRYKRFHANHISGDVMINHQVALSNKLKLETMGGTLELSGIVDATNPKTEEITCLSTMNGIYIDSLFYVFENFDQDFITDKNLRGKVTADLSMSMNLDPKLNLFPETLVADLNFTIRQGELNQFEPMQQLKKYLGDDGLNRLRFSDLQNEIHIEKKTIYIPVMEVKTNVTNLTISGTHTFSQQIDYRLMAPLRRKVSDPAAAAAIEEDNSGGTKLFLRIRGTTSDYKISYDTESVRKKIAQDLKNEVKELKEALKNKGQKKKVVELEENEYFDF